MATLDHFCTFLNKGGEDTESRPRDIELQSPAPNPEALRGIRLRPDQSRAVEAWVSAGCHGQVVMPTGAGKTIVALAAMKAQSRRTLIVVPSRELVSQWRRKIRRHLGEVAGVFTGEKSEYLSARRVITTYHSARKLLSQQNGFDMVVFDECHHLNAPTWGRLLELSEGKKILGLTATPEEIEGLPVVYEMTISEAVRAGAVSRVQASHIVVPLNPRVAPNALAIMEKIEKIRQALSRVEDQEEKLDLLQALASLWQSLRILLELTPEKVQKLMEILEREEPEKGLVFVETIWGCEELARKLRERGWPAYAYHSALKKHHRKAILEKLKHEKAIVVAAKALDEGIDVPTVKFIAILSCPKKLRRLVQRMGRGMRPGQTLKLYTITTSIGETRPAK